MLEAVERGDAAITPAIAARMLTELARPRGPRPGGGPESRDPDRLTERELDVLRLVVAGLRNKEIAARARDLGEHGQVPPAQHPGQAPRAEPLRDRRPAVREGLLAGRLTAAARAERPANAGRARPGPIRPPGPPERMGRRCPPDRAWPRARPCARCSFTRQGGGNGLSHRHRPPRLHHLRRVHGRLPRRGARHDPAGGPGIETGPGPGRPLDCTMEHPLQVGECIGCGICIRECPPNVMTLVTVDGEVPLAPRQGPIERPSAAEASGWIPLSQVTREALKPVHDSPWGDLSRGRPARDRSRGRSGRRWSRTARRHADRALPGGLPRGTDAGRYVA